MMLTQDCPEAIETSEPVQSAPTGAERVAEALIGAQAPRGRVAIALCRAQTRADETGILSDTPADEKD
jgi:hypothetical protein